MNSLLFKHSLFKLSRSFNSSHTVLINPNVLNYQFENFKQFEYNNDNSISIECKGRNSKPPKRANHGARPCSSVMRQLKKRAYYRKDRTKW